MEKQITASKDKINQYFILKDHNKLPEHFSDKGQRQT